MKSDSQKKEFKTEIKTIFSILKNKFIEIPIYQRTYSWPKENVVALLEDIRDRDKDNKQHYFGMITTKYSALEKSIGKITQKTRVIDGQQRLVTSLIIFIFLRRVLKLKDEMYDHKQNRDIVNFTYEMSSSALEDNIRNLIRDHSISLRSGNFKDNVQVVKEFFINWEISKIRSYYEAFKSQFLIAELIYDGHDHNDEMIIFENINSKATPLNDFDLIKNYFMQLNDENDKIASFRVFNKQIFNIITNNDYFKKRNAKQREKAVQDFFNYYLIFKLHDLGQEFKGFSHYEIYKNYKRLIKLQYKRKTLSASLFNEHVKDINKYFVLFVDIKSKKDVGRNIWLSALANKDNYIPLLFYIFKKFERGDDIEHFKLNSTIEKFIKVMAVHIIKLLSVEGTGQSLTKMWNAIITRIKNGLISDPLELNQYLSSTEIIYGTPTPSNERFVDSLLIKEKQKWIPRILIDIIVDKIEKTAKEKLTYENQKTLEHIFPQKAREKNWGNMALETKDVIDKYLNQIGNLILVDKTINSKLGNKSFEDKKKVYKNSYSPLITGDHYEMKNLASENTFDFTIIKKRTDQLSVFLIDIFNT